MTNPDKSRLIYLYAPSKEDKYRYEKMAKQKGVPLSKFLIGLIEDHINEQSTPREMAEEIDVQREEMAKLIEDLNRKTLLLERYEQELQRYKSAPFAKEGYSGFLNYDPSLIRILKGGAISDLRLMELLKIDSKDPIQIRSLSKQLEALEAYGLVTKTARGWRWIG
jgi:hypothetical protein